MFLGNKFMKAGTEMKSNNWDVEKIREDLR